KKARERKLQNKQEMMYEGEAAPESGEEALMRQIVGGGFITYEGGQFSVYGWIMRKKYVTECRGFRNTHFVFASFQLQLLERRTLF
ncbi:MAG: hypothetical protein E6Z15_29300, partial [Paenibacillus macerans]|nr:hypothetical protein [Paenibacillus macerans]